MLGVAQGLLRPFSLARRFPPRRRVVPAPPGHEPLVGSHHVEGDHALAYVGTKLGGESNRQPQVLHGAAHADAHRPFACPPRTGRPHGQKARFSRERGRRPGRRRTGRSRERHRRPKRLPDGTHRAPAARRTRSDRRPIGRNQHRSPRRRFRRTSPRSAGSGSGRLRAPTPHARRRARPRLRRRYRTCWRSARFSPGATDRSWGFLARSAKRRRPQDPPPKRPLPDSPRQPAPRPGPPLRATPPNSVQGQEGA